MKIRNKEIQEIISGIHAEMKVFGNQQLDMTFQHFLSILGYKKYNRKLIEVVNKTLDKYKLKIYYNGVQLESWDELNYSNQITLELNDTEITIQKNGVNKLNVRDTDFEEGVERVILGLKEEMEKRKNNLVYMKFRTFLSKFGYKRGSKNLYEAINEYLIKYKIMPWAKHEDNWDWSDLSYDEMVTFRFEEVNNKTKIEKERGDIMIENDYAGTISVVKGDNPFDLYLHQQEAIQALDNKFKRQGSFAGMLAIPTGGGKTLTAMQWLLRNAIDKKKKVLWIAHRHELLNQAFSALRKNSYSALVKNRKDFRYRVISGQHDRPVNIQADDDILIASKDSLYRQMDYLSDKWLKDQNEVLLVIDEAHHATAKTYRKVIDGLRESVNRFSMLGLTATPFRTSEQEKGLLKRLFIDDIIYKVDLEHLINRGILSAPTFEEMNTKLDIYRELTDEDVKKISFSDLKGDIAKKIASSNQRNNRIVEHYLDNREKYGKLLVFTIDIDHALVLNQLFNKRGIKSEYIVSSLRDAVHGTTVSSKENQEKIEKFRRGEVEVLINVNILTEGVDLPEVKTVFLTRPTISSILMTQMIGRALRGKKAGGTDKAYIVSFIDEWKDKINWVNPEKLYIENTDFNDKSREYTERLVKLVSIEKIEEFANIMDEAIDTSNLESIDFLKRIPVGVYSFSVLVLDAEEEELERNCEVLVYDDMQKVYNEFINGLEGIFDFYNLNDKEKLSDKELEKLCRTVESDYFTGHDFTLEYKREDIKNILRYYAFKGVAPAFLEFKDREKFDLSQEAKYIFEEGLGGIKKRDYIDQLWESEEKSWWKIFFNHNKRYFIRQLNIEIEKFEYPDLVNKIKSEAEVVQDLIELEKLSMSELKEKAPKDWRKLHDAVYERAKDKEGYYTCAISSFKSKSKVPFQIDHIIPISKGGLTTLDNLQLLTRHENAKKGDKVS